MDMNAKLDRLPSIDVQSLGTDIAGTRDDLGMPTCDGQEASVHHEPKFRIVAR